MIDFNTVTREIRSLIHRRKLLMTFLGSVFAATGLFLHNVLKGKLPPDFVGIKQYIFTFYAVMVMVPTMVLALRMARLHGGLVLNGMLYARLMQQQSFTKGGDVQRAAAHNWLGVSFLQFLLTNLFAGGAALLLALSLDMHLAIAGGVGALVFLGWLLLYFRFHHQAVAVATSKIAAEGCLPFEEKEWKNHVSTSLEDANTGLMSDLGFVGLIMFSMFEKITGLTEITRENAGPAFDDLQRFGPWVYSILMLVTCVIGLFIYIRVRLAIGGFSLQLDPTDRPFRPFRLTDSLLGYMLMAFLFMVSMHMVLILLLPKEFTPPALLFGLDAVAFVVAVAAEQGALIAAGRRRRDANSP